MTSLREELREKIWLKVGEISNCNDADCDVCNDETDAILTAVDAYYKSEMARVIGEDEDEELKDLCLHMEYNIKLNKIHRMGRNELRAEQRKAGGLDH